MLFRSQIAEHFHPDKIILFGSYAYGQPHEESDVDLLVVMPAYDVVNQEIRIGEAFDWPFSLDLMVRTPQQVERGLSSRRARYFMTPETAQWVRYAEEDLQAARDLAARRPPLRNVACFHYLHV